jgi:asparagine N-glycosylation enzyme membrane subunit Stt3
MTENPPSGGTVTSQAGSTPKVPKINISPKKAVKFLRAHWAFIAIAALFILSVYIRMAGYYNFADGSYRWPYLRNIDSYAFFADVEDIVQGNRMDYNDLALAPYGTTRAWPYSGVYQYASAYSYMIYNSAFPIPLDRYMAWFPAIFASLLVIPAYYIGKILYDRKAGVLTALFMTFSPQIMSRTLGGDPDNDGFVMLVAMLSVALFLFTYKYYSKQESLIRKAGYLQRAKNLALGLVNGIVLGFFGVSWAGYWFVFVLFLGFLALKVVLSVARHFKHRENLLRAIIKDVKQPVFLVAIMLVGFWAVTVPIFGPHWFYDPVLQPLGLSGVLAGSGGGIKGEAFEFPNVYVSVAELQLGGQVRDVAIRSSGVDTAASVSRLPLELLLILSPFIMSILAIGYLGYSYYKRREHGDTLLFVGLWAIGMVYASVVAVRFAIFLAPVFAICSSIFMAKAWRIVTGQDKTVTA